MSASEHYETAFQVGNFLLECWTEGDTEGRLQSWRAVVQAQFGDFPTQTPQLNLVFTYWAESGVFEWGNHSSVLDSSPPGLKAKQEFGQNRYSKTSAGADARYQTQIIIKNQQMKLHRMK